MSAQSLSAPESLSIIGERLFVSDTGNNRVLVWNTIPTQTQQAADYVIGQLNMTTGTANGPGLSGLSFSSPIGIYYGAGRLFINDCLNQRTLGWSSLPTQTGVSADLVLGQRSLSTSATQPVDATSNPCATGISGNFHLPGTKRPEGY
ncbi:MAG: hypothetical protein SGI74_00205 [Oligoflexia bacterium]|nr:hypothetical protein [Oligoflexia bacterium]